MFQYKPSKCVCDCNTLCKYEHKYAAVQNVFVDCGKSSIFKSLFTCLRDSAYYDIKEVVTPLLTSEIVKLRPMYIVNVIALDDFMLNYYLGGYKMWNTDNGFITVPYGIPSSSYTTSSDDPTICMARTMRCILKAMKEIPNTDTTTAITIDVVIPWINLDIKLEDITNYQSKDLSSTTEIMLAALSADYVTPV